MVYLDIVGVGKMDIPTQYKDKNDKVICAIMENAYSLWSIITELGCDNMQFDNEDLCVTIKRKEV